MQTMKNKLLIFISLIALICKKDEIKQATPTTCDCYERHEEKDFIQGSLQLSWVFTYNTTTQPDLCSKQTGEWIYSGNVNQYRYKVICN